MDIYCKKCEHLRRANGKRDKKRIKIPFCNLKFEGMEGQLGVYYEERITSSILEEGFIPPKDCPFALERIIK